MADVSRVDASPLDASFVSSLPPGSAPTLGLDIATPRDRLNTWKLNAPAWRGALRTEESYIRREAHLCEQPATRDGGITHWVLVDTAIPREEQTVLASCESYRKDALVARAGTVEEVLSYGIGSVFCREEFRGRGYGSRMMKEMAIRLRSWQAEKKRVAFTVLYSDIGKKYYNTFGWRPFPSSHISLPPLPPSSPNSTSAAITSITADMLPSLCATDVSHLHHDLTTSRPPTGYAYAALLPDAATMAWFHARDEFITREFGLPFPTAKGALVQLRSGERAWCVWTRTWADAHDPAHPENTLHILRLAIQGQGMLDEADLQPLRAGEPHSRSRSDVGVDPSASSASLSSTTSASPSTSSSHLAPPHPNGSNTSLAPSSSPSTPLPSTTPSPTRTNPNLVSLVAALLTAARREAGAWGFPRVELWNPTPVTVLAARQALAPDAADDAPGPEVVRREQESIASLLWYGDEQEEGGEGRERIEWVGNEKYGWC